jgi:hypothetical protein
MVYTISQVEIARRKNAYATLSISLIVGLMVASVILSSPVSIDGYLLVVVMIFLLGAFSFRYFRNLSRTKINLSSQSLKRIVNGVSEEYLISNINRIKVKWTTNNTIREVYIWLVNGRSIYISALDHFEEFKKDLLGKSDKGVKIEETREPLDFDHPLFYSILGLPISTVGVYIFKSIPFLDYQHIKIMVIAFSGYLLVLGIYFIAVKPLSRRYEEKIMVSDYVTGILMICLGMIFSFIFLTRSL